MEKKETQIYKDFDYIQGQIASLQALILGLAQNINPIEFQEQSLRRLEVLKTSYLNLPVDDLRLKAIDDCEKWVRKVSS